MKFLAWVFSVSQRHYREIRRYEKGGTGIRVFTIVFSLVLIAACLGLEYWFFSYLYDGGTSDGLGKLAALLGIGILFVAVAVYTVEYFGVFSFTAFRMAIWGMAFSAAKRKEILERKKLADTYEEQPETGVETGRYKAFDIVIGILLLLFVIALIVAIIGLAVLINK